MVDDLLSQRRSDVEDHPMGEKWFREWSWSTCEFQGFEPGSQAFEQCRREQVSKALSSPARASAVRAASTARSLLGDRE